MSFTTKFNEFDQKSPYIFHQACLRRIPWVTLKPNKKFALPAKAVILLFLTMTFSRFPTHRNGKVIMKIGYTFKSYEIIVIKCLFFLINFFFNLYSLCRSILVKLYDILTSIYHQKKEKKKRKMGQWQIQESWLFFFLHELYSLQFQQ